MVTWNRLGVPQGPRVRTASVAAQRRTLGERVHGRSSDLYPTATVDCLHANSPLAQLELLATQRVDPEKLRWQRLIENLLSSRESFAAPNSVRAVAAVVQHPLALTTSSSVALVDRAVGSLLLSIEGVSVTEKVTMSLAIAYTRLHGELKIVHRGAENWDRLDAPLELESSAKDLQCKPRLADRQDTCYLEGKAAHNLFWGHLVPSCLAGGADLPHEARVDTLLAIALAWRTLPSTDIMAAIEPALRSTAASALDAIPSWREWSQGGVRPVAHLVWALGMLEAQGAPYGAPGKTGSRLLRSLEIDWFVHERLPDLLMLILGLHGLALGATRLGREADALLQDVFHSLRSDTPASQGVCEALLLLRACGKLKVGERWACALMRRAANDVDRLQRGERKALRALLAELASSLTCNADMANTHGALPHPDSSAEAAISYLVRHDWFARKSRAQISWWRCRGALSH